MEFIAYSPFIKQLRTDGGYRIEFDVSADEYDTIKDLPKLQGKRLMISLQEDSNLIDTD